MKQKYEAIILTLIFMGSFTSAVTFRAVHFGHGCGGGVSINNIQKEVSWVVVGLTGIAWTTDHNDPRLISTQCYIEKL